MAKGKFNKIQANAENAKNTLSDLSAMADTDNVTIVSATRAGKTIIALEATPIVFDGEGKATVTVKEAKYLLTIPGYSLERSEKADVKEGKAAEGEEAEPTSIELENAPETKPETAEPVAEMQKQKKQSQKGQKNK